MKVSLSDQFIWDLYAILDKTGDVLRFITKPPTMANYLPGPKNPIFEKYRKVGNRRKFSKLIYRLKKRNYIKVKNLENRQAIMITKKGMNKVLKVSFRIDGKKQVKRKDGKWIMVVFDIPQKHKKARALLRSILQNLRYKIFQHSVWVSPYDVSEKTEKLLRHYSLDSYVRIFIIEKI